MKPYSLDHGLEIEGVRGQRTTREKAGGLENLAWERNSSGSAVLADSEEKKLESAGPQSIGLCPGPQHHIASWLEQTH